MYGWSLSCNFRWERECLGKDWFSLVNSYTRPVRRVSQELLWLWIFTKKGFIVDCIYFDGEMSKNIVNKADNFFKHTSLLHCRQGNGKNRFMTVIVWIDHSACILMRNDKSFICAFVLTMSCIFWNGNEIAIC